MKTRSIAAAAILVAAAAQAQVREADVTGGKVSGVVANGMAVFKGIPFAAPLVGDRRWKAPQPLAPWTGVSDGSKFGPACMQDPMFPRIFGAPPQLSEDCLYLNVWTPAKSAGDRLPVMVWIYGGGFVGGQTSVPLSVNPSGIGRPLACQDRVREPEREHAFGPRLHRHPLVRARAGKRHPRLDLHERPSHARTSLPHGPVSGALCHR